VVAPEDVKVADPAHSGEQLNPLLPIHLIIAIPDPGLLNIGKNRVVPKKIIEGPGSPGIGDRKVRSPLIEVSVSRFHLILI
jgi:hypothetical protein